MSAGNPPSSKALQVASSPVTLGKVQLKNRIAMAPMTRRLCPDPDGAVPNPEVSRYYGTRARGGTALLITEGVHVNAVDAPDAAQSPRCDLSKQHTVSSWREVADAVHAHGSHIAMQIWHTGIFSMVDAPIGPSSSAVGAIKGKKPYRQMSETDMQRIISDFASTAAAAVHGAGFDGVEIHGAHGYLLDAFASPRRNVRTDEYGGTWANRARFPARVAAAVRSVVGPDKLVIYRFSQWSLDDFAEIKWTTSADMLAFLKPIVDAGVDVLHVSCRRVTEPGFPKEHPTRTLAGWTRLLTGLPVIAVGSLSIDKMFREGPESQKFGLRDPAIGGLQLLADNECDMVAVGRGLLSDAEWGNKVLSGRWQELRPYGLAALKSRL